MKHRPIGLGIQGLADTLVRMKINFDSEKALEFSEHMMETIYHSALTASKDIAKERYDDMKKLQNIYPLNRILERGKKIIQLRL